MLVVLLISSFYSIEWIFFLDQTYLLYIIPFATIFLGIGLGFQLRIQIREYILNFLRQLSKYEFNLLALFLQITAIVLTIGFIIQNKPTGIKLFVLIYALLLFIFIHKSYFPFYRMISFFTLVDSKVPASIALVLFLSIPYFIYTNQDLHLIQVLNPIYYLLLIALVLQILESRLKLKKTEFNSFISVLFHTKIMKLWKYILINRVQILIFIIALSSIFIFKLLYIQNIETILRSQGKINEYAIKSHDHLSKISFNSFLKKVSIPVTIHHIESLPIVWKNPNIVMIWFHKESIIQKDNALFFQRIPTKKLYINQKRKQNLDLHLPDILPSGDYKVIFLLEENNVLMYPANESQMLVFDANISLPKKENEGASIKYLQAISINYKKNLLKNLINSPMEQRSKIELIKIQSVYNKYQLQIRVKNEGKLPWLTQFDRKINEMKDFAFYEKDVKPEQEENLKEKKNQYLLSQKSLPNMDNLETVQIGIFSKFYRNDHRKGESFYILPNPIMYSGQSVDIVLEYDVPDTIQVDEICISPVIKGNSWFYENGDSLLRIPIESDRNVVSDAQNFTKKLIKLESKTKGFYGYNYFLQTKIDGEVSLEKVITTKKTKDIRFVLTNQSLFVWDFQKQENGFYLRLSWLQEKFDIYSVLHWKKYIEKRIYWKGIVPSMSKIEIPMDIFNLGSMEKGRYEVRVVPCIEDKCGNEMGFGNFSHFFVIVDESDFN